MDEGCAAPADAQASAKHAVFVVKVVVGLLVGVACGVVAVQGWLGFLIFFALSNAAASAFVAYYQTDASDDEFGYQDAMSEGMMVGLSTFLLAWIMVFSLFWV